MQKEIKKTFSEDERARLRAALVAYTEAHGIGSPTLQLRIAEASNRSPELIPHKTLQRFLRGIGRAHDTSLIPYFQFAETLSPISEESGFAQYALSFFGAELGIGNAHVGRWEVFTPPQARGLTFGAGGEIPETFKFGVIEIRAGKTCPTTLERVINDQRKPFPDSDPLARHLVYEGILINKNGLLFIISRNCATRTPRSYWLQEDEQGNLIGDRAEAEIAPDGKTGAAISLHKFGLYPEPKEQAGGAAFAPTEPETVTDIPLNASSIAELYQAAYNGDIAGVKRVIADGVDINAIHAPTGLSALHVAVGTNNLPLTIYLVEKGAKFGPDGFGRWPTIVAAQCYASEELCDYIVEQEGASLQNTK